MNAPLPSRHDVARLRIDGFTDEEIAKELGVTTTWVVHQMDQLGFPDRRTVREGQVRMYVGHIWGIPENHSHLTDHPAQMLMAYTLMRDGDRLSDFQRRLVDQWVERLRGAVLAYDPTHGWYYQPRTPQDGDTVVAAPVDPPELWSKLQHFWQLPE
ncbi:hypothetical protein OIE69_43525 (plasmid) [Actinacidiphila glaucinigra]|uniref:hypothetical protein n=1 Tax=Actinacidiphila glaucinigra TaxID=235986 RepID=UPI002DDC01EB|nr:hypothetical protein [Actinacidiphila glaucinigra]WSD65780.1 hypothetical protein OIE69_43525 [Actinacidiphila glaucinigra]